MIYANETTQNTTKLPRLLDPVLIQAARQIYRVRIQISPIERAPEGVVINRVTCKGILVYTPKPILLPQETFIPYTHLEGNWS